MSHEANPWEMSHEANPYDLKNLPEASTTGVSGVPFPEPLLVVCVAVRLECGLILSVPRPGRHHHILRAWHFMPETKRVRMGDQGFLLSDGSFADRERAGEVALAAGQIEKHFHGPDKPFLYSECVW